jgi:hypothetical protein
VRSKARSVATETDYLVNCGLSMSGKVVLFDSIVTETLLTHLAPDRYEDQEHCPVLAADPLKADRFFWFELKGLAETGLGIEFGDQRIERGKHLLQLGPEISRPPLFERI